MAYTPPYPKPLEKNAKRSLWDFAKRSRRSWLSILHEDSYSGHLSRIRLPGKRMFLVKFPDLIKQVLVDKFDHFPKHDLAAKILEPLIGEGLFTSNGPLWERQRRMLDPAFRQTKLKEAFVLMKGGVDSMVGRFDAVRDGHEVDVELEMTHVTADIILRTIFSEELEEATARRIFNGFNKFQQTASALVGLGLFGLPMWLSPYRYFVWKKTGREIRGILAVLIRKRFDAFHKGEKGVHKDILESMLESSDPLDGTRYTVEDLIDQVAVLFLAGHETSASALSWSLFLLAKCPEIQEQLHAEVVAQLGNRDPDFKDIPKLKKVRNVFRETMRLYPPVGFLNLRVAVGDQTITRGKAKAGREIPDGSPVVVSPWIVHRHDKLWKNPHEFDPDRFEGGLDQHNCAYIPFGQGPRVCIGAAFAMQEAMLILAVFTRRYRFEPGDGPDPEPISRLTIRPADGISLKVFRRPELDVSISNPVERPDSGDEGKCPFH